MFLNVNISQQLLLPKKSCRPISQLQIMELPFSPFIFFECFLLFLISLLSIAHSFSSIHPLCHDEDRSALLDLKQSLTVGKCVNSDYFGNQVSGYLNLLHSWKLRGGEKVDCCSWKGVWVWQQNRICNWPWSQPLLSPRFYQLKYQSLPSSPSSNPWSFI